MGLPVPADVNRSRLWFLRQRAACAILPRARLREERSLMKRLSSSWLALVAVLLVVGCTRVPSGLQPVTRLDAERYLGRWYEIARLDHSFERGLSDVTAEYSARPDGGITVVNRGYDAEAGKWRETRGVARFRGDRTVGSLRVCFFWPFWGGYHIIALDEQDYRYAMVVGPSRSYLWILSRRPSLAPELQSKLLTKAQQWGFATNELIHVQHSLRGE